MSFPEMIKLHIEQNEITHVQREALASLGFDYEATEDCLDRKSNEVARKVIKILDIKGIPANAEEIGAFKSNLNKWRELMQFGDLEKSLEMREKLKVVLYAPFLSDIYITYKLFNLKLLLTERKTKEALSALNDISLKGTNVGAETLYHYYYTYATYYMCICQCESALDFLFKAETISKQLTEREAVLYYNIGTCFLHLDNPHEGIAYLVKAREIARNYPDETLIMLCDNKLSLCYSKIGVYTLIMKAKL